MANYYLPIEINNRRWHICHLNEFAGNNNTGKFSFIIDKNAQTLFEIPYSAKFISESGYSKNIKMSDCPIYRIYKEDNTFFVDFIKGVRLPVQDKKTQDRNIDGFSISKDTNKSNSPYIVKIDTTKFSLTSFNIVIRLLVTKNESVEKEENGRKITRPQVNIKEEYTYGFQIHRCTKQSQNFIEAAIDFGSEASQVSYKRGNESRDKQLCLIDLFKGFHSDYNEVSEFWQGKENEHLFKSVFFVNTGTREQKVVFQYADKPFENKKESFIQVLKPKTRKSEDYKNLVTLPNLKLMEYMPNRNQQSISIHLGENKPEEIINNSANLYDEEITESSLRLILSHILHTILEQNKSSRIPEQYLHITLLMPNVYPQKKVYTLMKNLYADFYEITKQQEYNCFKGIEIQMLSESDAAFLGAKRSKASEWHIPNKTDGHFLIIDAGKGTTDFSILKQDKNHTNFDSLYRTGIPASGHILTYAFFEALESCLANYNIDLKNLVLTSPRATVLELMDKLDKLKSRYKETGQDEQLNIENAPSADCSLDDINTFIDNNFTELHIPVTREKVKTKIENLLLLIKTEINKSGIKQFEQAIFTGRGFRFKPFREEVIKMLESENMLVNKQIVFKDDDSTKTICIDGAFVLDHSRINKNSELIGKPKLELDNEGKTKKSIFAKIFGSNNDYKDFFIDGIEIARKHKNFRIRVGGRLSQQLSNTTGSECFFYFTGDGFIIQFKNGENKRFSETYQTNNMMSDFVKQSLFPFYDLNIIESKKKYSDSNNLQQSNSERNATESAVEVPQSEVLPEVKTQSNSQIKKL
jgi:hypothetical protein